MFDDDNFDDAADDAMTWITITVKECTLTMTLR